MTLMRKASQLPTDGLRSERCSALAKKIVGSSEFAVFLPHPNSPASGARVQFAAGEFC
jgi:hypothetical protein